MESPTLNKIKNFMLRSFRMTDKLPSVSDISKKTGVASSNVSKYVKKLKDAGLFPEGVKQVDKTLSGEWVPCSVPCETNDCMLEVKRADGSIVVCKNTNRGFGDIITIGNDIVPLKNFEQYRRLSK